MTFRIGTDRRHPGVDAARHKFGDFNTERRQLHSQVRGERPQRRLRVGYTDDDVVLTIRYPANTCQPPLQPHESVSPIPVAPPATEAEFNGEAYRDPQVRRTDPHNVRPPYDLDGTLAV
ncbi:MAG: hypothetical protein ACM4D3_02480 [Candidatus Sericytochromatia bacterium]